MLAILYLISMLKNFSIFVGHRGTRIDYDENTLDAFEIALKSGANYIEFDVRKTKDNELVVFHDSTVDRITKTSGLVENFTFSEISQIPFKMTDSHIPALNEVIKRFKSRTKFIIELKTKNLREKVMELINYNTLLNDCIISGRYMEDLEQIKKNDPKIQVCYNISKGKGLNLENFLKLGKERTLNFIPDFINLQSKLITKDFIDICHNNEILALSWDFIRYKDPLKVIKGLIEMGIDGVLFDNYKNIKLTKSWLDKINSFS